MADFRLETGRLVLRSWREYDWATLFRLTNTPAVMRWLAGLFDADGMAAQRVRIEGFEEQFGHTFWAVERKDDGGHLADQLPGFCGLKRGDAPGSPVFGEFETGWRLREDAWAWSGGLIPTSWRDAVRGRSAMPWPTASPARNGPQDEG